MSDRRVVHLIVGLGLGGAETMLYQVLRYRSQSAPQYRVISLGASRYFEGPIRDLGIDVVELPFAQKPIRAFFRLVLELRNADTLCCWMYHANLIGFYAGKLAGVRRIVWSIRHSNLDERSNTQRTLAINRHCAKLSRAVQVIAYNGKRAREVHEEVGYCKEKGVVLDNGCDCERFHPSTKTVTDVRSELGIPDDSITVLSVTRYHPIKDVPNFIEAFSRAKQTAPQLVAIMCGSGIDGDNHELVSLCAKSGLLVNRDIYLLGVRQDVERLMAAADLYVLHSAGEAFPNTLIQAMACGCLCVSTDVGDARIVLESDDQIVASKDPIQLSTKMVELLGLEESKKCCLRNKARNRVRECYSIERVVEEYECLF